ncbi:cholest-4-en-3-one 26-monooxygenase [Streptosporangium becharense]|uniref:Cholest-4-en-3-one 26-monooxygenase n=1 Tax=Streptosporangium becharense TaxID=1816182 RepID=A0A7W9IM50_9ACTN|nr:cytochrome P450 [Streptosporangium becharense]MBB2910383.1 cholest-4-en-3-one 26-monooxygenase [Streptosporangium becharense]MBB5823126.1 cholest-4-en-3-one 26-monooxygenase [Streptosporangium becharense]
MTTPTARTNTPSINLVDPDAYARGEVPHDQLTWLRANAPVFWHEGDAERGWPGFWAVTRHADVTAVSRNPSVFSSYRRLSLFEEMSDGDVAVQRLMMLNQDPPDHTRLRSVVNRVFTPRMISRLEPRVREICDGLFDGVTAAGEADFVYDIAEPLPMFVICELLGVPEEDRDRLFHLSDHMVGVDDPDFAVSPEEGRLAAAEIYSYAAELAALRRRDPRDDITTMLLRPDASGTALTEDEFVLFVMMLFIAGNETPRNAASGGMLALFEHPDQWRRLRADPGLCGSAVEELLRWVTPVNLFRRTATRDTEIGGTPIAEGDKVVLFYASANRDEDVFADPFTFDVGRSVNPHVGFGGGGPHFCLGAHLARLELRVLLETVLERTPDIEQAGEARHLRSTFINGVKDLPVRFTPTPPRR